MSWRELVFETQAAGQTSFIKPGDFPDVPDASNTAVYLDGFKLLPGTYSIECEGALVRIGADLPAGATVEVRYQP